MANDYNIFVSRNLTITGSDTGGRVDVGGTASLPNYYSIGDAMLGSFTAPDNNSLDVDMSISAGPANVYDGNAYEGTAETSTASMDDGTLTIGGPSPIGVASQFGWLSAYATQLSQLAANSTVTVSGSTVTRSMAPAAHSISST